MWPASSRLPGPASESTSRKPRKLNCGWPEDTVADVSDVVVLLDIKRDVMQALTHLSRLQPNRVSYQPDPFSTRLMGRLMDVPAASQKWLIL